MKKFVQFELWKDCRNCCKFCFNKGKKDIDKLKSLDYVISKISNLDYDVIDQIGLIGGEFFDNQLNDENVSARFYDLMQLLCNKILTGQITKLYVTTSLIYEQTLQIEKFLNYIANNLCQDKILICTSYDTIGRFSTEAKLNIWKRNMEMLSIKYPNVKKHIEIIMTQDFIESVKSNKIDVFEMLKLYNSQIDYLEPFVPTAFKNKSEFNAYLPNFLPNRKDFITFITEYSIRKKVIDISTLFSKKLRSDVLYYIKDGKHFCISDRHCNDNTHGLENNNTLPLFGYADSDIQMCDDIKKLYETL